MPNIYKEFLKNISDDQEHDEEVNIVIGIGANISLDQNMALIATTSQFSPIGVHLTFAQLLI